MGESPYRIVDSKDDCGLARSSAGENGPNPGARGVPGCFLVAFVATKNGSVLLTLPDFGR